MYVLIKCLINKQRVYYTHTICISSQFTRTVSPFALVFACLPPNNVSFGTFSPVEIVHLFDTNVTYTCTAGYYISAGDHAITCQTDGSWSGTIPTCTREYRGFPTFELIRYPVLMFYISRPLITGATSFWKCIKNKPMILSRWRNAPGTKSTENKRYSRLFTHVLTRF